MDCMLPFGTTIIITKATEDDDGGLHLIGESSGPEIDHDEQFMTVDCIKDMAAQIRARPLPYKDEHRNKGVLAELGHVVDAWVTKQWHLGTDTLLDGDNPAAVKLWKDVKVKGKQYGQSVAGRALKLAKKEVGGKVLKGFDRVRLDHIANTTKPSWVPSLGSVVAKSQEWAEVDWDDVPEYEGDIPFLDDDVEKEMLFGQEIGRIPAHPKKKGREDKNKRTKEPTLVQSLRKLMALLKAFDWESYEDKVKEENRDAIPLQEIPAVGDLFEVGHFEEPPSGTYEKSQREWVEYIEKAQPRVNDIESLADAYHRLYHVRGATSGEDVLPTRAALYALREVMPGMAKAEPLVYGAEWVEKDVEALVGGLEEDSVRDLATFLEEMDEGSVLKSFGEVDTKGQVTARVPPPQPRPMAAEVLTDFSQVGQEQPTPTMTVEKSDVDEHLAAFRELAERVQKSGGTAEEKAAAMRQVGTVLLERMIEDVEQPAGGGEDIRKAVETAMGSALGPVLQRIEGLEKQLAEALSGRERAGGGGGGGGVVRKSIPSVAASRIVTRKDSRATFTGLVRGDQYMEGVE